MPNSRLNSATPLCVRIVLDRHQRTSRQITQERYENSRIPNCFSNGSYHGYLRVGTTHAAVPINLSCTRASVNAPRHKQNAITKPNTIQAIDCRDIGTRKRSITGINSMPTQIHVVKALTTILSRSVLKCSTFWSEVLLFSLSVWRNDCVWD